jgi:hypothetical protein
MMLPTSEEHYMFAVQVESRYVVADCLYSIRRSFMYCLPHFFKDGLGIHRKSTDVFVNGRELLFVCHMLYSSLLGYSTSQLDRLSRGSYHQHNTTVLAHVSTNSKVFETLVPKKTQPVEKVLFKAHQQEEMQTPLFCG